MALNLLGSHPQEEAQKAQVGVKMHIPQEPKPVKPPKQKRNWFKKSTPVSVNQPVEALKQVDLAEAILRRQALIRKLIYIVIIIVILLVACAVAIIIYLRPAPPQVVTNQPPVVNIAPPVVPPTTPVVTPTPIVNEVPQPPVTNEPGAPLQDTPLAPLRGSLINFSASDDVYLIENNGELRLVNKQSVIFENGQKFEELSSNLIYLLPDKWQNTRRGDKMVEGQVDFDPRVLSLTELLPFIQ